MDKKSAEEIFDVYYGYRFDVYKNDEKIKWKNFFNEQPKKGQRVLLRKVHYKFCEYDEISTSWDFVNIESKQKEEKVVFQWVSAEEFFKYFDN